MRATPTLTTFDIAGNAGQAHIQYNGSGGGSNTAVTVIENNTKGFMISKTAIGVDNYGAMIIKYNASAEL